MSYLFRELHGLYCTVLRNYSETELCRQRAGLEALLEQKSDGVAGSKSRRRTLRKQIAKIDAELMERKNVEVNMISSAPEDHDSCIKPISTNPQNRGGWGFWKT
jgi:hypothetical protein